MNDDGIEFGDVEQTSPDPCLRPERDPRLCVVAVQQPTERDLTVYIDADAMRDVELHASSDTRVELGGVLLGGRYIDDEGKPFVVVVDTLRAEHFEATKGSFKFTHETWEAISRQRDAYPDDVRMVGWYHTHPDWGVFLSGMDLFICQNFFADPLDLALVVDPCRSDRGWFQWTPGRDQPQRTGGFFLTASRHRREELEEFARMLEGRSPMALETRYAPPVSTSYSPPPAPVIHMPPHRTSVAEVGMIVALSLQAVLIALIGWKLIESERSPTVSPVAGVSNSESVNSAASLSAARLQVIEQLLSEQPDAETLAKRLSDQQNEIVGLKSTLQGLQISAASIGREYESQRIELERKERQLVDLAETQRNSDSTIKQLQEDLEAAEETSADFRLKERAAFVWYSDGFYLGGLAIAAAVAGLIGAVGATDYHRRRVRRETLERTSSLNENRWSHEGTQHVDE